MGREADVPAENGPKAPLRRAEALRALRTLPWGVFGPLLVVVVVFAADVAGVGDGLVDVRVVGSLHVDLAGGPFVDAGDGVVDMR